MRTVTLMLAILWATARPAGAEERWTVRSGNAYLYLNVELLHDLGIDCEVKAPSAEGIEDNLLDDPSWLLPIAPGSDLEFITAHGIVLPQGATSGAARLEGTVVLRDRATGRETRYDDLELAHPTAGVAPPDGAATGPLLLESQGKGTVIAELRNSMFDFRGRPRLAIHYLNLHLTRAWALEIGRPDLAGWVVGLIEVRAGAELLSATPDLTPEYQPVYEGGILDVSLGALSSIQQVAHTGTFPTGMAGLAMSTTSCNLGTLDVAWLAPMQEKHPLIHMALYRMLGGRFEQIGVSWLKHGFYALSNSQCSTCLNPSDGSYLAVGCSDTYDVGNNSNRSYLGPRSEVNAYTGAWNCLGSHFAGGQPDCIRRHTSTGHGPLDHRLVVADADLANAGATYVYEAYYVILGDQNLANNWGHRNCTMSWSGVAWNFTTPGTGNPLVEGPALEAQGWASSRIDVAPGDGQVVLAVQTTDLGNGSWHYEYALLNLNSDRQIRSFRVPVTGVPGLANIGFHDNDSDPANDWQVSADTDAITWQTATAQDTSAHPLVFGYQFNFRFDAAVGPSAMNATLGIFKPGPDSTVVAATTGPTQALAAVSDARARGPRVLEIVPNPLRHSATIRYQAAPGSLDLGIYDASGRRVRSLVDASSATGSGSVIWAGDADGGARVPAGVYYVRLRSGAAISARPIVLVD